MPQHARHRTPTGHAPHTAWSTAPQGRARRASRAWMPLTGIATPARPGPRGRSARGTSTRSKRYPSPGPPPAPPLPTHTHSPPPLPGRTTRAARRQRPSPCTRSHWPAQASRRPPPAPHRRLAPSRRAPSSPSAPTRRPHRGPVPPCSAAPSRPSAVSSRCSTSFALSLTVRAPPSPAVPSLAAPNANAPPTDAHAQLRPGVPRG